MSVAKLFWQDPYQSRLDTHVAGVSGNDVMLAETIFYALSGGQESDAGIIGRRRVVSARKDGREILYTLEDDHGLEAGDAVTVEIDWARRYNQRRYWKIEGFARVPCGGTHLKRTGEIGAVTPKRVNIGKGKERIEIRVGELPSA